MLHVAGRPAVPHGTRHLRRCRTRQWRQSYRRCDLMAPHTIGSEARDVLCDGFKHVRVGRWQLLDVCLYTHVYTHVYTCVYTHVYRCVHMHVYDT